MHHGHNKKRASKKHSAALCPVVKRNDKSTRNDRKEKEKEG
jgi:hypothetical protein